MSTSEHNSAAFFHVKWVGKIALLVAFAAAAGLLAVVLGVSNDQTGSYTSLVASRSMTQQQLAPVMWIFGLLCVLVAALTTWLIALYSSHRIAGPLFRFAQNLQAILKQPFSVPLAIRKADVLQQEWQEFDAAQARLRSHYGDLRDALTQCETCAAAHDQHALAQAVAKLQEVQRHAQV